MTVNIAKLVSWYTFRIGKLTYSMYGSRNGADGTADCSGSMTQALYEAGCSKPAYLYSTVTLPAYLQANGFKRIAQNQDWTARTGDVVLWSDGANMAASGGAGGHVMLMIDANNEISTDYSTNGAINRAVNEYNYDQYYGWNTPAYVEVWRYAGNTVVVVANTVSASKIAVAAVKPVIKQTENFECGDVIYIKSTATAYEGGSAINKADVTKRFTVVDVKTIKEYNSTQALLISTPTDKNKWLFGQDAGIVSRPNVKQDTSFNVGDQIYYKASATRYFGGPAIPVSLRTTQGEIIQTRGFQTGEAASKSNQLVQVKGDEHWLYAQDVGLRGRVNPTLK